MSKAVKYTLAPDLLDGAEAVWYANLFFGGPKQGQAWLDTPCPEFDGQKPEILIQQKEGCQRVIEWFKTKARTSASVNQSFRQRAIKYVEDEIADYKLLWYWWHVGHPLLDGQTPEAAFEAGDYARVMLLAKRASHGLLGPETKQP